MTAKAVSERERIRVAIRAGATGNPLLIDAYRDAKLRFEFSQSTAGLGIIYAPLTIIYFMTSPGFDAFPFDFSALEPQGFLYLAVLGSTLFGNFFLGKLRAKAIVNLELALATEAAKGPFAIPDNTDQYGDPN